jgi:hypothetical protein
VLVSGGGLGIGTAAVLGAISQAGSSGVAAHERVRVTAFDQNIEDAALRDQRYHRYREQMLSNTGFAIFLSGNKAIGDGTVVAARGVETEFEIAVEKGVIPIPIGASGHAAESIWRTVRGDPIKFFGDSKAIPALDRMRPGLREIEIEVLISSVFDIIALYDGRRR